MLDWIFLAISLGKTELNAPVPPVSVPAILSALVAISTLPATVVLAFTKVEEVVDHSSQLPQRLYVILPSVVNQAINQSVVGVAHNAAFLAAALA